MDWGADVVEEYGWRKGPWTAQEDKLLTQHVNLHGEGRWNSVSKLTGLRRCGKSCRLRWVNYLRPDLKRGKITPEEETIILDSHALWGNRWFTIARSLPGRTDNAIKNYWRIHFKKSKPWKNTVKARAQFLRQQQELQKQEEEQHQQKKQDENNMRMMMNQEEIALPQDMEQEIMCPLTFMLQGGSSGDGSISHGSTEEGTWGSLWQLDDDMQTDVQGMRHGSLQVQDQVLAFY